MLNVRWETARLLAKGNRKVGLFGISRSFFAQRGRQSPYMGRGLSSTASVTRNPREPKVEASRCEIAVPGQGGMSDKRGSNKSQRGQICCSLSRHRVRGSVRKCISGDRSSTPQQPEGQIQQDGEHDTGDQTTDQRSVHHHAVAPEDDVARQPAEWQVEPAGQDHNHPQQEERRARN